MFVTTEEHPDYESLIIKTNQEESRKLLYFKSLFAAVYDMATWNQCIRNAWMHFYKDHLNEFDWFMKADDDTYVYAKTLQLPIVWLTWLSVVKNLREYLARFDPNKPYYFGWGDEYSGVRSLMWQAASSWLGGGAGRIHCISGLAAPATSSLAQLWRNLCV